MSFAKSLYRVAAKFDFAISPAVIINFPNMKKVRFKVVHTG